MSKGRCRKCPKCGALYSWGKAGHCGACLMLDKGFIPLVPVYHSEAVEAAQARRTEEGR
jgi:hypothetical protein